LTPAEEIKKQMKLYVSTALTAGQTKDRKVKQEQIEDLFTEIRKNPPPSGSKDDYLFRDVGRGGLRTLQFMYEAKTAEKDSENLICHIELVARIGPETVTIEVAYADFGPNDDLTRPPSKSAILHQKL